MEGVTLPPPPEGYEYRLMKKRPRETIKLSERDPSELTPKQLSSLKYREKNKEKLNEQNRLRYQKKKNEEKSLSTSGQE
jgi:hypothetical protein